MTAPTPTAAVTDTFTRPCLACGTTVHVAAGVEQDHACLAFTTNAGLVAHAYWQGFDAGQGLAKPNEGATR